MIDKELVERLCNHKDPDIKTLAEAYKTFSESPLESAYLSILKQINYWLMEIDKSPVKLKNTEDSDNKAFEKAHKLMMSMDDLFDRLDSIRAKMSPEMQKAVESKAKSDKLSDKDKSLAL